MDKATLPQPIPIDLQTWMFPTFNRETRRSIAKQGAKKPDVHARKRCSGKSKALPPERNEYAKLQATRRRTGSRSVAA